MPLTTRHWCEGRSPSRTVSRPIGDAAAPAGGPATMEGSCKRGSTSTDLLARMEPPEPATSPQASPTTARTTSSTLRSRAVSDCGSPGSWPTSASARPCPPRVSGSVRRRYDSSIPAGWPACQTPREPFPRSHAMVRQSNSFAGWLRTSRAEVCRATGSKARAVLAGAR